MKSAAFHVNQPVFFYLPTALASILISIGFCLAVFLLLEFAPAFLPISRIRPNLPPLLLTSFLWVSCVLLALKYRGLCSDMHIPLLLQGALVPQY
jgi:hypothetical protein